MNDLDLDPNDTGKVTKGQFVSGLTTMGVATADATKIYDSIDSKKTGSITESEIETAIRNWKLKRPTNDSQGGPHAAVGKSTSGKSGKSGGSVRSAGASNSSATHSAGDTNKDGVGSAQETAI
jgi:Ca2+-binding EF-hand superfamily protein